MLEVEPIGRNGNDQYSVLFHLFAKGCHMLWNAGYTLCSAMQFHVFAVSDTVRWNEITVRSILRLLVDQAGPEPLSARPLFQDGGH